MNAELGRRLLDHVTANPAQFDMARWCECLAGNALALSGWAPLGDGAFLRPSGGEVSDPAEIGREARRVLGLSGEEFWRRAADDGGGAECLFAVDNDEAVEWLRELVEKAEADRG